MDLDVRIFNEFAADLSCMHQMEPDVRNVEVLIIAAQVVVKIRGMIIVHVQVLP